MNLFKRILLFFIIFFIITQIIFTYFFPSRYVYTQRVNYEIFKDNIYSIEYSIKEISNTIKKKI